MRVNEKIITNYIIQKLQTTQLSCPRSYFVCVCACVLTTKSFSRNPRKPLKHTNINIHMSRTSPSLRLLIALLLLLQLLFGEVCRAELATQVRMDYYLNQFTYPESWGPPPVGYWRLHAVVPLTTVPSQSGFATVSVGGVNVTLDPSSNPLTQSGNQIDWVRCVFNYERKYAWVSLHSSHQEFLSTVESNGTLEVYDGTGAMIAADTQLPSTLPVTNGDDGGAVQVSFVSSRNNYTQFVIHVHNFGSTSSQYNLHTVNGARIQRPSSTIPAGGHDLFVLNITTYEGFIWTVVLESNGVLLAAGGKLIKERFYIEGWAHSSQCVIPTSAGPSDVSTAMAKAGIDAFFNAQAG